MTPIAVITDRLPRAARDIARRRGRDVELSITGADIELDRAIQGCLEDLPEDFRLVVVLVDVQGFDYMEAAEVMRAPVGTVKSRLHTAVRRFAEDWNAVMVYETAN